MPSKETVTGKQELRIIAGVWLKGSGLSGSKSFMIKTSALVALHDEEQCTQIINMSATVTFLSYHAKVLNFHCMVHQENMNLNPFTA